MSKEIARDADYWTGFFEAQAKSSKLLREAVAAGKYRDDEHKESLLRALVQDSIGTILAAYTAGFSRDVIREQFASLALAINDLSQVATLQFYVGHDRIYQVLGLAAFLDIPKRELSPIWNLIEIYGVKDELWDWLIVQLGGRSSGATKLVWPEAYEPLYRAATGPLEQAVPQIAAFLDQWYANMKDCSWYDSHLSPHTAYFGYWSFEAAAVVKFRGIDDTSCRDHPNYPVPTT